MSLEHFSQAIQAQPCPSSKPKAKHTRGSKNSDANSKQNNNLPELRASSVNSPQRVSGGAPRLHHRGGDPTGAQTPVVKNAAERHDEGGTRESEQTKTEGVHIGTEKKHATHGCRQHTACLHSTPKLTRR